MIKKLFFIITVLFSLKVQAQTPDWSTTIAAIFYNNCTKNGILLIELPQAEVDTLTEDATNAANPVLAVNLPKQTIGRPNGTTIRFEIDAARKTRLLEGLDDIGQTLKHLNKIRAYEERRQKEQPWL